MRDDIQTECISRYLIDGKADAIDAHRPFFRDVAGEFRRDFERQSNRARVFTAGNHNAYAVDVTADEVATESIADAQRRLEIDRVARPGRSTA